MAVTTVEIININVQTNAGKAARAFNSTATAVGNVGKAAKKVQSPLGNFVSSLKRIAYYRVIRGIIKSITQSFKEGLEWAYNFSKGLIDSADSSGRFAAAMDRIKTASSTMKAQLGSAFIALLAAIEPILIKIINLVTAAADAISQLISAFTGTTYIKAAGGLAKAFESGAKSAKEWKNQLLGFDEINRLNEPSGGGGGSSPLSGIQGEDTKIAEKYLRIAEKIKEHLDLIKWIVVAIGTAILAWKLGKFMNTLLSIAPKLTTVLEICMAIGGAIMFAVGAIDAWKNGVDWDNFALMVGGVALAFGGVALAVGVTAGAIVLLVGGIAMLVIGIRDWIKTGELSTQTFWLLEAGIIAVGTALALLVSPIALVVAAVAAAALAIYKYWDDIKAWWKNNVLVKFQEGLDELKGDWQRTKDWFVSAWESFKQGFRDFAVEVGNIITSLFQPLIDLANWIDRVLEGFGILGNINARVDASTADGSIYLTGFASGGFPTEGQLFLANEGSAPEMVGQMGGHTAVANNDQIVEGIKAGVFEAVSSAMSNGGNDVSVKIYLDSREIKAGQERLARAWG